jgi:iron complex outermembrane receptor protein
MRANCRKRAHLFGPALFAIILGAWPTIAFAQAADDEPAAPQQDEVEEIVVTAQRRSENLQRVPIAITVITPERLESAGVSNTLDLQAVVPGLIMNTTTSNGQTFLRGVGQDSGIPGVESAIATYVDGIYLGAGSLGVFSLTNVEQVAVLRGPQGTLFGRNSTGGLIQITTRAPADTFGGNVQLGYGNYDTISGSGYLTGPLADGLSASLAVSGSDRRRGTILNINTGNRLLNESAITGQAKLRYRPSADWDITAQLVYGNYDNKPGTVFGEFPGTLANDGITRYIDQHTVDLYADPYNRSENIIGSIRIVHDMGRVVLTNTSSILDWSGAASNVYAIPGLPNPNNVPAQQIGLAGSIREYQEEFQIQSAPGQSLSWIVGAFYMHDRTNLDFSVFRDANFFSSTSSVLTTDSYSLYAQATKSLLANTRLTLGARYTIDRRSLSGITNLGVQPPATLPPQRSWSEPTWRVAIDHDFAPDIMGYISYNRGFKSGNYANSAITSPPANPETNDAFEAGLNTRLFGRRLRLNMSGFYYSYRNLQVRALSPAGGLLVYNAAAARIYGLDVDFEAILAPGLTVGGGFEVLHAKFTDFPTGLYYAPTPITAPEIATLGCTGTPSARNGGNTTLVCDLTGNNLARAPKFSANVRLQYDWTISGVGDFSFNVADQYLNGYYFEPDNNLRQPGYHWITSSLSLAPAGSAFTLRAWVTNLFNARTSINSSSTTGTYLYAPGETRMYGVTAGYRF